MATERKKQQELAQGNIISVSKMKSHVVELSRGALMGSTASGADWCLKALHPADPLVEVRGIPDKSAVPSAFINYQAVFTISPTGGATGTWTLDAALLPEPIAMLSFAKTDSTGDTNTIGLNPQITGGNYGAKLVTLLSACQRWRLAYASMTVTQDGPDLANQGTVVCCQKASVPYRWSFGSLNGALAAVGLKTTQWGTEDEPEYSSAQAMPNSYFAQSKYGLYAPMKLTKTCQHWKDLNFDITKITGAAASASGTGCFNLPGATSANTIWPYYGLNQDAWSAGAGRSGDTVADWGNDVNVQASFRNMAVTTSLTFFVRMGIEIQCTASSIYAPQLKLSPPCDSRALKTYFAIAREMKDAYPADYNDLAKIWGVIKRILGYVAPAISAIPHPIAQAFGMAIPAGVKIIDNVSTAISQNRSNGKGTPSAGDIERARQQISL